jgi:putative ABC transport system ATP-binding protein
MLEPVAVLSGVEKSYQMDAVTVPVLRGIDVLIRPAHFTVVLGPSGSGKTTMLNLIGCIDRADKGSVSIAGTDVDQLSDDQRADFRAAHIGFVFQNFNLLPVLTAFENVEYPLMLAGMEPERRKRRGEETAGPGGPGRSRRQPAGGSSAAASASGSPSPAPWRASPGWSSPTSRPPTSTARPGAAVIALMRRMQERYRISFIFSSHDRGLIGAADDLIILRDGVIQSIRRKATEAVEAEQPSPADLEDDE